MFPSLDFDFQLEIFTLPRRGAVLEQGVEVGVGQQLAAVHARLDGPQTPKYSDLKGKQRGPFYVGPRRRGGRLRLTCSTLHTMGVISSLFSFV